MLNLNEFDLNSVYFIPIKLLKQSPNIIKNNYCFLVELLNVK